MCLWGYKLLIKSEAASSRSSLIFVGVSLRLICYWMAPHQDKDNHGRELAWLASRVLTAENRATEIEGLLDQINLRLSLLGSSQKKAYEELQNVKVSITPQNLSDSLLKMLVFLDAIVCRKKTYFCARGRGG